MNQCMPRFASPRLARVAGALAFFATPCFAQVAWTLRPLTGVTASDAAAYAYDSARGVTVRFGGSPCCAETWEWQGTWLKRTPTNTPPNPGNSQAMAYDAARRVAVLFVSDETWEWDGVDWTRRETPTHPSARGLHCMAYDAARQRVVLFGGQVKPYPGYVNLDDTWEWDGVTWVRRTPTVRPAPRMQAAMAYDAARGRVVLFGGTDDPFNRPSRRLDDTWAWDGQNWTQMNPQNRPPKRNEHTLAYDEVRQRVVFLGPDLPNNGDTWEWDGTDWTDVTPAVTPFAVGHGMVYDRSRGVVVQFGGQQMNDTWFWDGTAWTEHGGTGNPTPRATTPLGYDASRQRVVLFDGNHQSETWEWDGTEWNKRVPATRPPARAFHAMVGDSRGVLVFGGFGTAELGDTWEWNGTDWSRVASTGPSARLLTAMAYDRARDRVVLFGGGLFSLRQKFGDTWEWDGATWSLVATEGPPARDGHAMAYDEARQRVVLFGGYGGGTSLADTWEWDGRSWTARTPAVSPSARLWHAMAYDEARERVVLFGGSTGGAETWEWDGTEWLQRAPSSPPPARIQHGLVYHRARRSVVLFGGSGLNDTWEYGPADPANATLFGTGCAGSAGTPVLTPSGGLPWLGSVLGLSLGPLPPGEAAFLWVGASNTTWGNVPLPLSLGFLGAPACSVLVSADVTIPLVNTSGQATWSIALCHCPSLVGTKLYFQGGGLDSRGPWGFVLSNGLATRLGAK